MPRAPIPSALLLAALAAASLPGCDPEPSETPPPVPERYEATIRYTAYGVPHVLADDLGGVAFGQGYAFARDHACILADQVVKLRSERARFFGPGDGDAHVDSDLAYLNLDVMAYAEQGFSRLSADAQEMVRGYAAGYNQWLSEAGADGPGPECAGAEWVRPITEAELLAWYLDLGLYGSAAELLPYVATALPPGGSLGRPAPRHPPLPDFRDLGIGSNGWGIGAERSASGRGMLVGNPHFPWEGELKLYESHLTIPGRLDVYGASLMGVAGVLIGFNEAMAWTHTVSYAPRFTVYMLTLDPSSPTRYAYGDEVRDMTSRVFTVQVLNGDGTLQPVSRTMWRSHYGPMLDSTAFGLPWSSGVAFTFRDANENNLALIDQWIAMATSTGLEEFKAAHRDVHGVPWVHTTSASREGEAWYADGSAVPRISDLAMADWLDRRDNDFLTSSFWGSGVVLLDGGDPAHEWVVGSDAAGARGLVPFDEAPQLLRSDFVHNANDNHWLAHPGEPLEGYDPFYGDERSARSPRDRMNLRMLAEVSPEGASGADGTFTLEELATAVVNNRSVIEELVRSEVVARCGGAAPVTVSGQEVDLGPICAALAAWNGRMDLDAPGGPAWREFLGRYDYDALVDAGELFAEPFDPQDPVETPRGLVPAPLDGDDPVLQALGAAALALAEAGLSPDATMGEAQYTLKDGVRIPIHGTQHREGGFNIVRYEGGNGTLYPYMERSDLVNSRTGLTVDGYPVNGGSSFVMAMEFTDEGPRALTVLTYSQSGDPSSPHFDDQTLAFSDKRWKEVRFAEEDIAADPDLQVLEVSAVREAP